MYDLAFTVLNNYVELESFSQTSANKSLCQAPPTLLVHILANLHIPIANQVTIELQIILLSRRKTTKVILRKMRGIRTGLDSIQRLNLKLPTTYGDLFRYLTLNSKSKSCQKLLYHLYFVFLYNFLLLNRSDTSQTKGLLMGSLWCQYSVVSILRERKWRTAKIWCGVVDKRRQSVGDQVLLGQVHHTTLQVLIKGTLLSKQVHEEF